MLEEDAIQAGELALGVLERDERAAALRRMLAEPAFAAEVARWRRRFSGLVEAYPPVEAPASVERQVMAAVGGRGRVASVWRPAAIAASLIAASLAVVMVWPGRGVAPVPVTVPNRVLVAALQLDGGKPFSAVYDVRAARVAVMGAVPSPSDRNAELWLIAPGGSPRPLGLLGGGERSNVIVHGAERRAMDAGATLAISIEPRGGSPTGLPTGPVVASGALVEG